MEHENWNYEWISSVRDGDIEVYARKELTGWLTIASHEQSSVVLTYEEEKTKKKRKIGSLYVRPLREVGWFEQNLDMSKGCDMIIGDLNARHASWGTESGNTTTNAYGRKLKR